MPIGAVRPWKLARARMRGPETLRSTSHKAFVRTQPCVCRGKPGVICQGDIQAAHFRTATGGGQGLKPSDAWCFPACWSCHARQHQVGEKEFQRRHGLNLRVICISFAQRSPDQRIRETVSR